MQRESILNQAAVDYLICGLTRQRHLGSGAAAGAAAAACPGAGGLRAYLHRDLHVLQSKVALAFLLAGITASCSQAFLGLGRP